METIEKVVTAETPETEEVCKLRVNLERPVDFNPVGDIKITSTNELSKIINDIFSPVFEDYYGCQLSAQFNPERQCYIIVPILYFRVLKKEIYSDPDKIFAFRPIGGSGSQSIIGRVQLLSQSTVSGQKVMITDEGKSVFEELVIVPASKTQEFDWKTAYRVVPTETDTFVQSFKFDINKFVAKIFGEKDENGSNLYYQITPSYPIGGVTQYKKPDNWALQILRLNHKNEAAAAEMLGLYIPNQGTDIQGVITEHTR